MSEMRIPKGWKHFGSNNLNIYTRKSREEIVEFDKKANNMIRTISKKSTEDLKKEGLNAAMQKEADKQKFEAAVKAGKIKSKKKTKKLLS